MTDTSTTRLRYHSWYGKTCHVVRHTGKIVRATISDLVLEPSSIRLLVWWTSSTGAKVSKNVSPCSVLYNNIYWFSNEVVSDDPDTENEKCPEPDILPILSISTCGKKPNIHLTVIQIQALQALFQEIFQVRNRLLIR
jgi:hypothetical protein